MKAKKLLGDDQWITMRDRFDLPNGIIYLNGNSLGPLPKSTKKRLAEVVDIEWGQGLIRSWNNADWVTLPQRLGALCAPLIGAQPEEVIVTDSTSVNLYKLIHAGLKLNSTRRKIVTELGNFPTDLYVMQGIDRDTTAELCAVPRDQLDDAIDEQTALVVLTHVHYKTGDMFDINSLTRLAHDKGALILWDLSHSTGAVPIDLNRCQVDLAVGCGYKYLNGGPGAPSFLYVANRHLKTFEQPLTGWFGHANPFAMSDQYEAASGIDKAQCGTPSVLASIALEEGLKIANEVNIEAIRHRSTMLSDLFIELIEARFNEFELATTRDSNCRGSHVSLKHPEGFAIMQALIDKGVIGDFRAPDILRFGFAPLYIGADDVKKTVDILEDIMTHKQYQNPKYQKKGRVT